MSTLVAETKFHKTKAKPIMAMLLFGVPFLISGYAVLHYFLYGSENGFVYALVMIGVFVACAYFLLKKVHTKKLAITAWIINIHLIEI